MTLRIGVVMDPIETIHYQKDTTLALLCEAEARGHEIYYFELRDLFLRDCLPYGNARRMQVAYEAKNWYAFKGDESIPLSDLDVILMRKDPPFNEEYIYATYLLERAERLGVLVVNRPQALRDCNEKFFATLFPQCVTSTLVTQSKEMLHAFWREHKDIVCKPLNGMGGISVYRLLEGDVNANVIFDTLTHAETFYIMAQKFISEISQGDKRIIMINGEPYPHLLARMPQGNDWRGNLAVGAKGVVQPLSDRDRWIANQIGPVLKERGIIFAGLDVIGDYLTEINITSPTCVREIDAGTGGNICARVFDVIEGLVPGLTT